MREISKVEQNQVSGGGIIIDVIKSVTDAVLTGVVGKLFNNIIDGFGSIFNSLLDKILGLGKTESSK